MRTVEQAFQDPTSGIRRAFEKSRAFEKTTNAERLARLAQAQEIVRAEGGGVAAGRTRSGAGQERARARRDREDTVTRIVIGFVGGASLMWLATRAELLRARMNAYMQGGSRASLIFRDAERLRR